MYNTALSLFQRISGIPDSLDIQPVHQCRGYNFLPDKQAYASRRARTLSASSTYRYPTELSPYHILTRPQDTRMYMKQTSIPYPEVYSLSQSHCCNLPVYQHCSD